jgi:PIN domain nuclease of toxin-antitoxin system
MSERSTVVLDTHVWIWLASGEGRLRKESIKALEYASAHRQILIPAICVWEVALLASRGKISLDKPVHAWIQDALSGPGISLAPLTPEVCIDSCSLPGAVHADPADRIIIATARVEGATLVTRDARILDYAKRGYLDALQA